MPPTGQADNSTQNTPLAPSVEKAYYRKCIELKRRLNEVEHANDELKLKRVRLDRAIMKIRLERAFLLDQLAKRMEQNVEGSEGSADEAMATPPPDRPHRDKRRRAANTAQPAAAQSSREPAATTTSNDAAAKDPAQPTTSEFASGEQASAYLGRESPYESSAPVGMPGATAHVNGDDGQGDDGQAEDGVDREAGVTGTALSGGPETWEDANGERRLSSDQRPRSRSASQDGSGAFSAVNR